MKKRGHRRFHKNHNSNRRHYNNGCSYCGGSFEGIPHKCKYCGELHCSKHLLPEDHNCKGLKPTKHFNEKHTNYRFYNHHYKQHTKNTGNFDRHKRSFHIPKFNFTKIKRISPFFKGLILAILTYFLAVQFSGNDIFLWLEAGAWLYFSFVIFRKAFRWANRVNMADDLSFFGLRFLGGIVAFVGLYIGFFVLLSSLFMRNSAPITIALLCIVAGLVILGVFIAFRTNRRHQVVGIWRA